ncbi:MAG: flagellar basal body-associated FliL family protein [Oligoflexia bacterium]|nr:flagellar basal body-associated FliL family protein [Oligoflexia bacterium]
MAEERDSKNPQGEESSKPKPSFREKLPKILKGLFIGLNAAVMLGGLGVIYNLKLIQGKPAITEESESAKASHDREIHENKPVLYSFDPFVVNLDGRPRKIVRTSIQLEMLSDEGYEEVVSQMPVARDQIVRILNRKKYEDIETIQGKLFLKDQIMTVMNSILRKGSVKEVYFNEFVVQ